MSRKKPNTPRSRVTSALRQLWLRSRERAKALKGTGYKCRDCGAKQSKAKGKEVNLEVHHDPPILWKKVIDMVFEVVLNAPQYPLCKDCHKKVHNKDRNCEKEKVDPKRDFPSLRTDRKREGDKA